MSGSELFSGVQNAIALSDQGNDGPVDELFWLLAMSKFKPMVVRDDSFPTQKAVEEVEESILKAVGGEVVYRYYHEVRSAGRSGTFVVTLEDAYLRANVYKSSHGRFISLAVSAVATERCTELLTVLRNAMYKAPAKDSAKVKIAFWTRGKHGNAASHFRQVDAPPWGDVRINYEDTCPDLSRMARMKPPLDAGSLILLYGPPGTGKTYAIRALAREWGPWCRTNYITDPERFFGDYDYMYKVASNDDWDDDRDDEEEKEEGKAWYNLLVIEDAEEFLGADAKAIVGTNMSRLLNLADGLLGQGLRLLLMMTTNEDVGKLHKAVTRAGRCLMRSQVSAFSLEAARTWLDAHRIDPSGCTVSRPTLADLYALLRDQEEAT